MEADPQSRTLKLLEDLAYVSVDEPQGFPSSTPGGRLCGKAQRQPADLQSCDLLPQQLAFDCQFVGLRLHTLGLS
jgi:hypothetical protein